jgi:8-oxo-dGTP pyrophosphatase MutT (NUDIX family)
VTEELVDIVDDADRVIATVTRAEMRARRLQHRSVGVAVMSTDGRLLIHRRSDDKDIWPGWWDIAAGGVVTSGETYDEAARRELSEELGIMDGDLQYVGQARFADEQLAALFHLYRVVHDGPFSFDDGEIVEIRWVTLADLDAMRKTHRFVPDSFTVLLPLLR